MKLHRTLRVCFAVWTILALTACSAPTVEPASQEAPVPVEATELPTVEATTQPTVTEPPPTATFTQVPTATATLAPTPTDMPVPTPTPVMVTPGYYGVGTCLHASYPHRHHFCLSGVYVNKKRELIFNVTWQFGGFLYETVPAYTKRGAVYITDNFGKTYGFIAAGGDARLDQVVIFTQKPKTAWFKFPTPQEGAVWFTFHESMYNYEFGPIGLSFPSIVYHDVKLMFSPYILVVRDDFWEMQSQTDGTAFVSHKEIQGCTVQETAYTAPQGKLKSKLDIGSVTYEIYGYILEDQNLGVREYVAVGGLEGMGEDVKPFFVVKIPLDESQRCINDVSDLMAKLSITGAE